MKTFTSKSQKLGLLGEDIVCKYLRDRGFTIIERNYTKKWGEIDIIVAKEGMIRFIEVKSATRDLGPNNHVLDAADLHRPEDGMHAAKRRRLSRTIQTYMASMGDIEWHFDVACILIDPERRRARIKIMDDIVL
ncbi:MAG: YraN family protein [bacterium]|nr:YraN family protein [bacterium]